MIPKNKKKRKRQTQDNRLIFFLLIIAVLIIYLAISNFKLYQEKNRVKFESDLLMQELNDLENQKDKYSKLLNQSNEQSFLEEVARTDLYLQKPEEKVIVIKKEGNEEQSNTSQAEPSNFFENVINWFKSLFNKK